MSVCDENELDVRVGLVTEARRKRELWTKGKEREQEQENKTCCSRRWSKSGRERRTKALLGQKAWGSCPGSNAAGIRRKGGLPPHFLCAIGVCCSIKMQQEEEIERGCWKKRLERIILKVD